MSDNEPGEKAWRFLAVVFLALGTLSFGLAGLCGAFFTLTWPEVSVISVPILLMGGGVAWACGRGLYKFLRRPNA
jgi:hypothetical protein